MTLPIIKIREDRLAKMLQEAYNLGCNGWPELGEDVAEKLISDFIESLSADSEPRVINRPKISSVNCNIIDRKPVESPIDRMVHWTTEPADARIWNRGEGQ